MQISKNWLNDYVDLEDLSAGDFSGLITTRVAEVDRLEQAGEPVGEAIVGYLKKVTPHPTKPQLKVVRVAIGTGEVDVVCGAPNCVEGILAAYLPVGAKVCRADAQSPTELELVTEREIGGVKSQGMLASERELGLTGDHGGIFTIEGSAKLEPGTALSKVVGQVDSIIVIDNKSLTHRPDLWGHFGFAREIAALLERPLKQNPDLFADVEEAGAKQLLRLGRNGVAGFEIEISPESKCKRFSGIEIDGVSIVPSPLWLRRRLFSIGAGVRNLPVDLSNYVMHDIGQPNHAYDVSLITGRKITIRQAKAGERFVSLDDVERTLSPEDVVIADSKKVVGLGGVIGGRDSSICETTTRIFLESANFDPVLIRTTAKRHQLRTDASNRFEKSPSPFATPLALHRYLEILSSLQSQVHVVSMVSDNFPLRPSRVVIPLRYSFLRKRLGAPLNDKQCGDLLRRLHFELTPQSADEVQVTVPYFRASRDVTLPEDLVEEVGRTLGYENIPERAPLIESSALRTDPRRDLEHQIRDLLSAIGFSEIYNYSFTDPRRTLNCGYSTENAIKILNPIDSNQEYLRTSLVPGLIEVLSRNTRHSAHQLLFELGRSYEREPRESHQKLKLRPVYRNVPAFERRLLGVAILLDRPEAQLSESLIPSLSAGVGFYQLANVIQRIVRLVSNERAEFFTEGSARKWMHPNRWAYIRVGKQVIGEIAEIMPGVVEFATGRGVIAELDIELLLETKPQTMLFSSFPKYPESYFELSVVMPEHRAYAELEQIIHRSVDSSFLRGIEVLSVYQGPPLEKGEKSISVRLSFCAPDHTLAGEELTAIQGRLTEEIRRSEFSLRS